VDAARIHAHADDFHNVVVAVSGEVDLAVHDELVSAIRAALGAPGVTGIVVDLSQTSFMDASGIRALLAGRTAARMAGVGYRVVGMAGSVRCVLEVTRVLDALIDPAWPDRDGAVSQTTAGDVAMAAPTAEVA
jgi:anti-sigma B factor antagonist